MGTRNYEWPGPEGQDTPVERPLSVANLLLDPFFNQRNRMDILENHGTRHDTVHLAFDGPIH
jgi:hypothetical protein